MTGTLDFTGQLTLATGTVTGLTARLDATRLGDITLEGVYVLIVEALAFRAIGATTAACATASTAARIITVVTAAAVAAITTTVATVTAAVTAITTTFGTWAARATLFRTLGCAFFVVAHERGSFNPE
jgi:hypothetical protein